MKELLTNSQKSTYQECPKKYSYTYEQGYKPVNEKSALVFGSLFHECLELWFQNGSMVAIHSYLNSKIESSDILDVVKARELMVGYDQKWRNAGLKTIVVEKEFRFPLVNPNTMHESRTFDLGGKIDVVVTDEIEECAVVEHKTTVDDIKPESNYWLKLAIDPQISGYFVAAETMGYNPKKIIYDVIRKPGLKLLKATPEAVRKYKKDGTLYASQRENDELPLEYGIRLRNDIEGDPNKYFARQRIARLENDLVEYTQDVWSVSKLIMESRNNNHWPRRTNQCFTYGKCQFYGVCAKTALLEDQSMFQKNENVHQELSEVI